MSIQSRGWCSPERYVQGPGIFDDVHRYTDRFGTHVVALIDSFFYESLTVRLGHLYDDPDHTLSTFCFQGEVTMAYIDAWAKTLEENLPDVLLAIGGGKTIDVVKAVGTKIGKPFIVMPTAASTDAPTSSLSVVYDENGVHQGEFFYDHSPCLLLVDSQIIANGPVRLLVSGMGDALATLLEADATKASYTPNLVYHKDGGHGQTLAGYAIAKTCYQSLLQYGVMAKMACEKNVVTEALEHIIETNILLSGLGFENNATAGAHSINDGLTALPSSKQNMHGEHVAFGCLVQLVASCVPQQQLDEVADFCLSVGLPVCLADLHMDNDVDTIRIIAENSMHSCWGNMPYPVTVETVFAAIQVADVYGAERKAQYHR